MAALEAAMVDPDQADEMDEIIERYGEVQERFEELDGYALDGRAREVLDGLGFSQEMMDGDVGKLSGGWKMRVALARILLMRPDGMLLDEPSNHLDLESLIWLEAFLKGYDGALLMTSHDREFMNRIVGKVVEIDGGSLTTYSGDLRLLPAAARARRQAAAGAVRAPAGHAGQGNRLHRALQGARLACRPGAEPGEEARQDRPRRAAQAPARRCQFEFQPAPRCGEDVVSLKNVHKGYGSRTIYEGLDFQVRRKERWCVMGVNGAGKSTLLKLVAGARARHRHGQHRRQRQDGLFRPARHGPAGRRAHRVPDAGGSFPQAGQGALRALAGCFGFSGDDVEKRCRVLSGGEKARLVMAKMLFDPPNLLVLDEPTNHLDIATKEMLIAALAHYRGHHAVRLARPPLPGGAVEPRAGADARGRPPYGGGYTEYVARTGQEAPGLRAGPRRAPRRRER
jgi:ATPase subunit of ABC transporter with duplicated ATPase domains